MLTKQQIEWIQKNTSDNGYKLQGEITITHKRPWSSVATVPTTTGNLFCKILQPELFYEAPLTEALFQWGFPVPEVVAADAENGWLLITDSGQSLRSLLQADGDSSRWHTAGTQYAQMQIALADRSTALLDLGVFDRRLSQLPHLYTNLLRDREALLIDQEPGLSSAEYNYLGKHTPEFGLLCQRLAAFGIPETLHHDDFHDNNIYVSGDQYTFADWGEACLAHPFFSMIIVLGIAAYTLKLDDDDPFLAALLDTYLTQWQAYGSMSSLKEAYVLAQAVGAVNRALTWHRMMRFMSPEERAEQAASMTGWLQEFLRQTADLQS